MTNANNRTPAGQQYDAHANDIARLIDVLQMELEAHRQKTGACERGWAGVGDLEKVRSDLINTVAFMSNKDRDEVIAFLND